ncbi:MAG TPA: hypothetical protein VF824_17485 [Thermoanaerobaculia bacterium]|jgi:hypothetical protein
MRLLISIAAAVVIALHAAPVAAADAASTCPKDIFFYFDVSRSMYKLQDGVTAEGQFTGAISYLLRGEHFVDPDDRLVVIVFAEKAHAVRDTHEVAVAADAIDSFAESAAALSDEWVGNKEYTDLASVGADIARRIDPSRKQIFLIASDFAHHPSRFQCRNTSGRSGDFRAAARRLAGLAPELQEIKLALITSDVVAPSCGDADATVAKAVKQTFGEILNAGEQVPITQSTNRIANSIRQAIADPVTLEQIPASTSGSVAVAVKNPNPFPVTVSGLTLSGSGGKQEHSSRKDVIGCQSRQILQAEIPDTLASETKLTLKVDVDTPEVKALPLKSSYVVITPPRVNVFEHFFHDSTYVIDLKVENTLGDAKLSVTGIPGHEDPLTYRVPPGGGPVALTIRGDAASHENRIRVVSTTGALFVKSDKGVQEQAAAEVSAGDEALSEMTMPIVDGMAVLSCIGMLLGVLNLLPIKWKKWWHLFHLIHEGHIFTGALGSGVKKVARWAGIATLSRPFGTWTRFGPVESSVWAILGGILTLYLLRNTAVYIVWPRIEPRLMQTAQARSTRTLLARLVMAGAAVATVAIWLALNHTLGTAHLLHPVTAS